ncbi:uncharacterized protein LOC128553140, partial [Mercenaria mercenaria]|uniref:uncharacterized protein LOC128553140 n=1 Tax=Mercenaria mercenaria TaxID=6596 RepID=UPI00234E6D73
PGSIRMVVIDEADLILSSERFRFIVYELLKLMPKIVQKIICLGTVTHGIEDIEKSFMSKPFHVKEELALDGIQQYKIRVEELYFPTLALKLEALWDVYEQFSINQAVIFCNKVDKLREEMSSKEFPVSVLHSNIEQDEIQAFNTGSSRVLVTADLDINEIDICNVSHIINFDFPCEAKDYIRRIGLLKSFEREGIVINFVTEDDEERLRYIERLYQTRIKPYAQGVRVSY